MLSKGCIGFLTHMVSKVELSPSIDKMLAIQKFLDVFPNELSRLAHKWEIEFSIELASNTTSISKAHYWIALIKLQELKNSHQSCLRMGL